MLDLYLYTLKNWSQIYSWTSTPRNMFIDESEPAKCFLSIYLCSKDTFPSKWAFLVCGLFGPVVTALSTVQHSRQYGEVYSRVLKIAQYWNPGSRRENRHHLTRRRAQCCSSRRWRPFSILEPGLSCYFRFQYWAILSTRLYTTPYCLLCSTVLVAVTTNQYLES